MTAKWKKRLRYAALVALGLVVALVAIVETGLAERWARRAIIAQLEKMTGGRVELRAFRFRVRNLRAELEGLVIHGRGPEGTPPFFAADLLLVDIRVDSLIRRRISLDEARLERPRVHVRIDDEGHSNVPEPQVKRAPGKPLRERIFDVVIRQLRLNDGELLFNNTRTPLVVEGRDFRLALDYRAPAAGAARYEGIFEWKQMTLVARRYLPFGSDVAAKFTLTRENFTLDELRWKLPASEFEFRAALASFARPEWTFRFGGTLGLEDLRTILRKPNAPSGHVEFTGEGRYAGGKLGVDGRYTALDIAMPYRWFHTAGMSSRGSFQGTRDAVVVPDFEASVLGGTVRGRVEIAFKGLQWRADTRARGMDLAALLRAVDNPSFPVATLHWGGGVDVDSVTTWEADFKHVDSRGTSVWTPHAEPRAGEIPATARFDYHYRMDRRTVELAASEIATPASRIEMQGRLGATDSALNVKLDAREVEPWDDFINRLRGRDAEPRRIAGRMEWQGRVLGPLGGPTFAGRFHGFQATYDQLYWDELEGEMVYSPREFRLERARARRGRSSATLALSLELHDWSFRPESQWSFEANLVRAATDDLQALFGTAVAARGVLTGRFRGRGTRGDPELTGAFDITEAEAWGFRFDRVRGELGVRHDEVRVARAELRWNGASITGDFLYRLPDDQTEFRLAGAAIPLEKIERIQTARVPLGGQLSFELSGKGPLRAPAGEGTLHLTGFRVGGDVLGSFEGRLRSDSRRLEFDVHSAMETGRFEGTLEITLGGDYPLRGELTAHGIDLDAFIESAFRLRPLTGHSFVDGRFRLAGAMAKPETISVEADVTQLKFDYQQLKFENVGPLRVAYRREEVRFEQAHIRGPDTDFTLAGYARFTGDQSLNLNLAGTVNLRLLAAWLPKLEARGAAQVNAAIAGTLAAPRITGRAQLAGATANYGDFPAGLSQLTGEFVFDRNRLVFENVTAEAGGGRLALGGTVTYGEGPLRYDLALRATRVRIRYPVGMSWLAGGTLRLAGTTTAAMLSGRVAVERLFMAPGFDLAALIVTAQEPVRAPEAASNYLRNLQFDIEAVSTPDARMEWSGARVESEASLRVRGTWEHPILLGHIHLLSGEMAFRGNRYRLTRGDLNFANPFRLDPLLGVEAVTTIRQYEVTLNFTGPASRLTLAYRSDPPLPASDIITLLALGRTGEESELRTHGQAPELGATALLSEAISSQIGGRIERLFGVSRFKVDPFLAGTGSEQNASARITIEQQITRDLTITYITNVTSTQQQVIQVEYSVSRDVSIVALRDQNGTFGLDIKFKKRFK